MTNIITEYQKLINKIAFEFTKKFLLEQYEEKATQDDYRIIGNADIGFGTIVINDTYYFGINEIITLLNNKWHTDIIKNYYNFGLEQAEKQIPIGISFYNYGRKQTISPDILEKERQEDLKQSEKKVEEARKLLFDML